VAELADALDLGSSIARCAGSSPASPTNQRVNATMAEDTTEDMTSPEEPDLTEEPPSEQPEKEVDSGQGQAEEDGKGGDGEKEEKVSFVEDPSFDIEYQGDCAYQVKVSIPPANEKKYVEDMFDELKEEAELPGFRKGRAPRRLLERKFGKVVKGEVAAKLANAAYEQLVEEQDLRPIALPEMEGLDNETARPDDEPITFTLKFEVAPRVTLGAYQGVEVERPVLKIEDKDIDDVIDQIRSRYAVFETVEEGTASAGDQVVIDFKGTVDGAEFAGGSASEYPYILGTRRFFPEFEDALLGASPGDERTCEVTLPETFPNEDLRGKQAVFSIKVTELKRRSLPKLDDEFAKQAGHEDLEEMRAKTTEDLRARSTAHSDNLAQARAIASIVENSDFEIPKSLIKRVADDIYEQNVRRLMQMRMPISEITTREETLREEAEKQAVDDIKQLTVLDAIGAKEGIEVTEKDYERAIEALSAQTGLGLESVSGYIDERDQRSTYESRILREKTVEFIMANAKIKDVEVKEDELEEQGNEFETDAEEA
jgi:trigger factor